MFLGTSLNINHQKYQPIVRVRFYHQPAQSGVNKEDHFNTGWRKHVKTDSLHILWYKIVSLKSGTWLISFTQSPCLDIMAASLHPIDSFNYETSPAVPELSVLVVFKSLTHFPNSFMHRVFISCRK